MNRRFEDYGPYDPLYVFVRDDGTQVHIDISALYEWVREANLEVFDTPIQPEAAIQCKNDGAIQPQRVLEMMREWRSNGIRYLDPVIFL